eukprot:scaffold45697_cov18-Tisochrysis_lutea.AAC.3
MSKQEHQRATFCQYASCLTYQVPSPIGPTSIPGAALKGAVGNGAAFRTADGLNKLVTVSRKLALGIFTSLEGARWECLGLVETSFLCSSEEICANIICD